MAAHDTRNDDFMPLLDYLQVSLWCFNKEGCLAYVFGETLIFVLQGTYTHAQSAAYALFIVNSRIVKSFLIRLHRDGLFRAYCTAGTATAAILFAFV